jgi:hypothetical protein
MLHLIIISFFLQICYLILAGFIILLLIISHVDNTEKEFCTSGFGGQTLTDKKKEFSHCFPFLSILKILNIFYDARTAPSFRSENSVPLLSNFNQNQTGKILNLFFVVAVCVGYFQCVYPCTN